MRKVVIITYATYSHHTGILPIIKSLLSRNIKVYVFGRLEYEYLYKDINIEFIPYIDDEKQYKINNRLYEEKNNCTKNLIENNTQEGIVEYLVDSLKTDVDLEIENYKDSINKIREINPELIIKDACCFHGSIIGKKLGIRTIGYVCNLAYTKELLLSNPKKYLSDALKMDLNKYNEVSLTNIYEEVEKSINRYYEDENLPKINLMFTTESDEKDILVFSSNNFHPKLVNDSYKIIRYDLFNKNNISLNKSNTIYISAGTVTTNNIYFYYYMIEAFKNSKYNIIISAINAEQLIGNLDLPSNISIEKFVDQKKILSEAVLFISHGGYNGICEAIYYEVPLMIYPLIADNYFNASLVNDLGIGIDLRKIKFNAENIYKLASYIINNDDIKNNLKILKEDFFNTKSLDSIIDEVIDD